MAKVALLILEGDPNRYDSFQAGIPSGTEILTVETKAEAETLLDERADISLVGTTTVSGAGVFSRALGIAKMNGREQ